MTDKTEQRITELEIRLTHQDESIESLSNTIIRQHDEIDTLKLRLEILEKRLKSVSESQVADQKDETPPPHY
jgi:SlyX protein